MNENTKSKLIVFALSLVPYLLLSWAYMHIVDGGPKAFWQALWFLVVVRLIFAAIETLGSVLVWRFHGKQLVVDKYLESLRSHKFPDRIYEQDDFSTYLSRIADGEEFPAALRSAAREMTKVMEVNEDSGILVGMRMWAAAEEALEIYSPRAKAPSCWQPSDDAPR
jgi:hypothetical protein